MHMASEVCHNSDDIFTLPKLYSQESRGACGSDGLSYRSNISSTFGETIKGDHNVLRWSRVQNVGPSSDTTSRKSDKAAEAMVLMKEEKCVEIAAQYHFFSLEFETFGPINQAGSMSLLSYLYIELTRGYWLEYDKARFTERRKRVYLFLTIPFELEKFIMYGFFQCVDGFLFLFTFLPLRFIKACLKFLIRGCFSSCWRPAGQVLNPAEICDLLKGIILIVCCLLMNLIDVSMMYHMIRGQTVIKLYIFFNMLDVADKLCSSFGQDILDSLFWTATEPRGRKREHFGVVIHVVMAIIYVFFHSTLVLLQVNTLNVAFNSHNKALLTIMMSNNFVELKGSVFKKFEKNNLFQMSCSDVRERFHLMFLLTIVAIRNLTDFSWNLDHIWVLVPDIIVVMLAELVVDWVKHAFITKFNELQPEVYKDYTLSIAYDMASSRHANAFCDHLDTVSRRMGFIPLPLAVLLVRVVTQSVKINSLLSGLILLVLYFCLFSFKVLNSIVLLGKAHQYIQLNRHASAAARTRDQSIVVESKLVSKDDLHLLSSPKSSLNSCDSPAIRRSQSLGEIGKDDFLTATIESHEGSLSDLSSEILRQNSLNSGALLSNSTVSLVSVQLNSTFVEESSLLETSLLDTALTNTSLRKRSKSECAPVLDETEQPLSEVNRYTMCSNRII